MVVGMAVVTFVASLLGGLAALRGRDRLHLLLGFTGGVVVGVVAFEVLPEVFELAGETGIDPLQPMVALVVGYLVLHVLERLLAMHGAHEAEYHHHEHPEVGVLSAVALSTHSFVDGIGIGLAYQVGHSLGITVAIAVAAHQFTDGLNTVGIMLSHGNSVRRSMWLLALDAIAPALGALATLAFTVPDRGLLLYLGYFAGFLLYLGSADILPEAHSRHPSRLTMVFTVAGFATMYAVAVAA